MKYLQKIKSYGFQSVESNNFIYVTVNSIYMAIWVMEPVGTVSHTCPSDESTLSDHKWLDYKAICGPPALPIGSQICYIWGYT